jgi:mRNA interferase HicA
MKRWLSKLGASFAPGKGSHLHVTLNGKITTLPMHPSKELAPGTVNSIKKALGLK